MGADSISSDALLLLLETVNKQASQIKRLESIVSGDTYSARDATRHGGGSDRSNKQQLQQLQTSLQALEQQHVASCTSNRSLTEQLHKMEQRVQQLEAQNTLLQQQGQQLQQQLGSPAPTTKNPVHRPASTMYTSIMAGVPSTAEDAGHAALPVAGMPGGRSMAARLNKLEQQMDALAATAAATENKVQSATSAVQALDDEVSKQLHYIRADVQQAIAVATGQLRSDVEAAALARQQADAAQLKEQLKGLTSELDALVANSQRTLIVGLTAEMERRAAVAQEASDGRATALRAQVDRLEEEKADITLVTQYTGQVADVFEQLATTVADSTQASIAQLMTQQQELRNMVTSLSASKADGSNLLQHQQHCQQQLLELQRGLAAAQAAASEAAVAAAVAKTALEPVDALRLQLAETQGTVAALQATAAGLDAATNSSSGEQQQQAQQLQQLASSLHMLQQQLLALTNHVDPAAAAQLAAAAAGDESALTFQPLGPLGSGCGSLLSNPGLESLNGGTGSAWDEAWATSSYLQCSQAGSQAAAASASGASSAAHATGAGDAMSGPQLRPVAGDAAGGAAGAAGGASSVGPSSSGGEATPGSRAAAAGRGFVDRMSAVLRHLPVAVRLLRLETAVRELNNTVAQKATAGDVHGLQQQLESMVAGLTQLEGVSTGSMRRLEEQSATLADAVAALGDSLDERPTHDAVQEVLQQQLLGLGAELDAVKARLRGAGQDLQHLKDWQAQACKQVEALQAVRQEAKQLQQQVVADLAKQQQEVQQLLTRHSADVARDTIKQFRADQEASQGGAEAIARVASLESKLKLVVAEVDRMQEQAALTARLQDKHTDMMGAFEAALSAQSSKYTTVSQQLRLELKEALVKANQSQSAKAAALQASLKEQSDALADLAATLGDLPSKGGLIEAALKTCKASVEELLAKHKQQEERRWEVWLAEFARAMEQRPTAAQLQKQLQAAQQAAEGNAHEAAAQRIECATAALEAHLRQQLRSVQLQLEQLRDRAQVLEQGTGIGPGGYDTGFCGDAAPGAAADVDPSSAAAGGVSPTRAQLLAGRAGAKMGFGAALAEDPSASGRVSPCDTAAQRAADTRAAARQLVGEAGGPPDTAAAAAGPEAAGTGPEGSRRVSVAAMVAAFEGSPAAAALGAPAACRDTQSPQWGAAATAAASSPAAQWRQLPFASSLLAEAAGAAAAASPRCAADSSVVARADGSSSSGGSGGTGSSSETTVEASSVYSSCEGDSITPTAPVMLALPQLYAGAAAQPAVVGVLQQQDGAAGAGAAPASPSMVGQSPGELLQGLTPPGSCGSSRLTYAASPAAAGAGVQQGGRSPVQASVSASMQQPDSGAISVAEAEAAGAADCTSELQQLLDLQQQVQACLVDSGCVPVGRRAKPPRGDRAGKKGHKRTRVHSKEGSSAAAGDAGDPAATAVVPANIAAGPARRQEQEELYEAGPPAAEAESSTMSVDDAIAAAAAALADRRRPAAAAGAAAPSREAPSSAVATGYGHNHPQQQQPQYHPQQQQQQLVAQAQPGPLALARPSRSQEIRSLLTLQQQLAQCLKDHGCFLEQQRQQQQQQAVSPSPRAQRVNVQEAELEQLLVLQAQMQQAVRHQG